MSVRPASDDSPSDCGCTWARERLFSLLGSLVGCFEGLRAGWRVAAAAGDSEISIATLADKATEEDLEAIENYFMEGNSTAIGALVADVLAREEPTYVIDNRWLSMSDGAIGTVQTHKGPMQLYRLRADAKMWFGRRVYLFTDESAVYSVWYNSLLNTVTPERPLNRTESPLDASVHRAVLHVATHT